MLFSISLIMLVGMLSGYICQRMKLPGLLGMILTGIILGPYVFNLIDASIINISAELRKIALIIILTRAGLSQDISELKQVGRPAVLMCFVPATFEILGMIIIAPKLLGISIVEAAVMGTVVAAVSPAVIVPKMIKLMEEGYGSQKNIPQMILAGASVDDVYVIVMFTAFTSLASGKNVSIISFVNIPVSILMGIFVGSMIGVILSAFFKKIHIRDTTKVLIILCISFMLVSIEDRINLPITFSALISIMLMEIVLQKKIRNTADRLSIKFNKLWVGAEVILFVLVGAAMDISYVPKAGIMSVAVIFGALSFRIIGVYLCLIGTSLNLKEKIFCVIGYIPKATVQAAIGAIPLGMGLGCGEIVLTIAVISILITAPLGAFLIDALYKKLLVK